jgi:histidyl-tRNA synthetase
VQTEPVDLFVAVAKPEATQAASELTREAWRAGLSAQRELSGRSLKGQLKHADRIRARYVAIVSGDTHVDLKDMASGNQREVTLSEVIAEVQR